VRERNVPTPVGEVLLRHIFVLNTLQYIKPTETPWPRTAIAVNADSLATWFEDVAWEIAKRNVALELMVDDQDYTLPLLARRRRWVVFQCQMNFLWDSWPSPLR
jgi:LysR family transcriptional regulator (chromosome initiation inhibitor)